MAHVKIPIIRCGYVDWVYPWRINEGSPVYGFGDHNGYTPIMFEVPNDAI